jgi:hypothetical protein
MKAHFLTRPLSYPLQRGGADASRHSRAGTDVAALLSSAAQRFCQCVRLVWDA